MLFVDELFVSIADVDMASLHDVVSWQVPAVANISSIYCHYSTSPNPTTMIFWLLAMPTKSGCRIHNWEFHIFIPKVRIRRPQFPCWYTPELRHLLKCLNTYKKSLSRHPTSHLTRILQTHHIVGVTCKCSISCGTRRHDIVGVTRKCSINGNIGHRHGINCWYLGRFE